MFFQKFYEARLNTLKEWIGFLRAREAIFHAAFRASIAYPGLN